MERGGGAPGVSFGAFVVTLLHQAGFSSGSLSARRAVRKFGLCNYNLFAINRATAGLEDPDDMDFKQLSGSIMVTVRSS